MNFFLIVLGLGVLLYAIYSTLWLVDTIWRFIKKIFR